MPLSVPGDRPRRRNHDPLEAAIAWELDRKRLRHRRRIGRPPPPTSRTVVPLSVPDDRPSRKNHALSKSSSLGLDRKRPTASLSACLPSRVAVSEPSFHRRPPTGRTVVPLSVPVNRPPSKNHALSKPPSLGNWIGTSDRQPSRLSRQPRCGGESPSLARRQAAPLCPFPSLAIGRAAETTPSRSRHRLGLDRKRRPRFLVCAPGPARRQQISERLSRQQAAPLCPFPSPAAGRAAETATRLKRHRPGVDQKRLRFPLSFCTPPSHGVSGRPAPSTGRTVVPLAVPDDRPRRRISIPRTLETAITRSWIRNSIAAPRTLSAWHQQAPSPVNRPHRCALFYPRRQAMPQNLNPQLLKPPSPGLDRKHSTASLPACFASRVAVASLLAIASPVNRPHRCAPFRPRQ